MTAAEWSILTTEQLNEHLKNKFPEVYDIYNIYRKAIPKGFIDSKYQNKWHTTIKSNLFNINEMPSGCGTMLFSNYYYYNEPRYFELTKYVLDMVAHYTNLAGYITTSGSNTSPTQLKFLNDLGFVCLTEYINLRHPGTNDKQQILFKQYSLEDLNNFKL